jgi:glycosyltransferase involved in cell wall biosynthesis
MEPKQSHPNAHNVEISVIITTHNGHARLRDTLPAVFDAMRAADDCELLIIDNASSDRTVENVTDYVCDAGLQIRIIAEPRKGKSFGLNRGLAEARGRLVAFLDDDIIPSSSWLQAFRDASDRFPGYDVFTGQIRPAWPCAKPPQWLVHLTNIGLSYGCSPKDRPEGPCNASQAKGANLMVRKSSLEAGHRFDEGSNNFGIAGGFGGEDVRFAYDVLRGRENSLIFVPSALVLHVIKPHELRFIEVLKRYARIGRSRAARLSCLGRSDEVAGLRKVAAHALKAIGGVVSLNVRKAAKHGTIAAMRYGEWSGRRSDVRRLQIKGGTDGECAG